MSLLSCQKSNAELCNLPRMSSKLHLPGIVRLLQTCHRQKRHFHKHVLQFWLSWGALLHTRISTSLFEKMVEASCQNVITQLQVLLSDSLTMLHECITYHKFALLQAHLAVLKNSLALSL